MDNERRRSDSDNEVPDVRGAAVRIVREGIPFDDARFRETDPSGFSDEVKGYLKGLLGDSAENPQLDPAPVNLTALFEKFPKLTSAEQKKLKELLSPASYSEAVATAKEVCANPKIISLEEIIKGFAKMRSEVLKETLKFAEPTLLIVPNNSFEEKKDEMNNHKYYPNQSDIWTVTGNNEPYRSVSSPVANEICVVEGKQYVNHIPTIPSNTPFKERREKFKKHYSDKGIKLIDVHQYATLIQRSLRMHKKDQEDIIDYTNGAEAVTCLNDEHLTNSPFVADAYFSGRIRGVKFNSLFADDTGEWLRPRASVQVLTY